MMVTDLSTHRGDITQADMEILLDNHGRYRKEKQFGDESVSFTISKTSYHPPINKGPVIGQYDLEPGQKHVRQSSPSHSIPRSRLTRQESGELDRTKCIENTPGPGYYREKKSFGQGMNNMIIGERRETSIPKTKGPGDYNITQADRLVMKREP